MFICLKFQRQILKLQDERWVHGIFVAQILKWRFRNNEVLERRNDWTVIRIQTLDDIPQFLLELRLVFDNESEL